MKKKKKTLGKEDVLLVHPKTASTASSSIGALVAAGSFQQRYPTARRNQGF